MPQYFRMLRFGTRAEIAGALDVLGLEFPIRLDPPSICPPIIPSYPPGPSEHYGSEAFHVGEGGVAARSDAHDPP